MSFDQLGLTPELLRAVADQGYTEPTPVQAQAIPHVLAGRDLLAGAQTGTGKTAAFVLPILQYLHANAPRRVAVGQTAGGRPVDAPPPMRNGRPGVRPARVLVLVPTRELALQVEESVRTYGAQHPVRSVPIYGGVGYEPQFRALRGGPEIVVATPGRLLDHINQRTVDLSAVEILVLDEADRMLDMGFIRDIRKILELLPARRQNLLFSATFNNEIRNLAAAFLDDPAMVQATPRNTAAPLVRQVVIRVDRERKRDLLRELVASGRVDQALVFTRTKHGANKLAEHLVRDGITAAAIHGNRSQSQRVRALEDFKAKRVQMLVATEVAARGLDIEELPHVVNFELPMVPEDYLHRIGRTGRAGSTGDAISLVCVDEQKLLRDIEQLLGRPIEVEVIEGFEPDRSIRPQPIRLRTGAGGETPRPPMASMHREGRAQGRPTIRPMPPRTTVGRGAFRPSFGGDPSRPSFAGSAPRPGSSASRPTGGPGPRPFAGDGQRPVGPRTSGPRPGGPRPGGSRPAPVRAGQSFGATPPRQQNGRPSHPPHRSAGGSGPGRPAGQWRGEGGGNGTRDGRGDGRPASLPGERFARHGERRGGRPA